MTTVRGFAFDGANEFQEEADLDFPASLDDDGLVCAGEFALVFHTAEFAFDDPMTSCLQTGPQRELKEVAALLLRYPRPQPGMHDPVYDRTALMKRLMIEHARKTQSNRVVLNVPSPIVI
jgi:hypothetical protein